ncbi:hypothetical protein KKF84_02945 [Myxococcota bacterium]|nr:hypothetical protein [Myxococcota bacterium]
MKIDLAENGICHLPFLIQIGMEGSQELDGEESYMLFASRSDYLIGTTFASVDFGFFDYSDCAMYLIADFYTQSVTVDLHVKSVVTGAESDLAVSLTPTMTSDYATCSKLGTKDGDSGSYFASCLSSLPFNRSLDYSDTSEFDWSFLSADICQ